MDDDEGREPSEKLKEKKRVEIKLQKTKKKALTTKQSNKWAKKKKTNSSQTFFLFFCVAVVVCLSLFLSFSFAKMEKQKGRNSTKTTAQAYLSWQRARWWLVAGSARSCRGLRRRGTPGWEGKYQLCTRTRAPLSNFRASFFRFENSGPIAEFWPSWPSRRSRRARFCSSSFSCCQQSDQFLPALHREKAPWWLSASRR